MVANAPTTKSQSLKQKLFAPLLISGAVIASLVLLFIKEFSERQLIQALHERSKSIATLINYTAETVTRRGELQRIVSAIGAEPDVVEIVVAAGTPTTILASSRIGWAQKSLTDLSDDLITMSIANVIHTRKTAGSFNAQGNFFDFTTPLLETPLVPSDKTAQIGAVLVHLDARQQRSDIIHSTVGLSIGLLLGVALLTGLGYWRLNVHVIQPLASMRRILRARVAGEPFDWNEVNTNDEIGALANVLRQSLTDLDHANLDLKNQKFALDQHALVTVTDVKGAITYANDLFCSVSGYSRAELLGQTHRLFKSNAHPPELYTELWQTISKGLVWRGQLCNKAKNGSLYWLDSTMIPLPGPDGKPEAYIAIRTDITALREAQRQASSASRAKSEFLANMSHEIRTPLNAIIGITQLVLESNIWKEQRELLSDVESSAQALLRIINDLLDVSKIESGKLEIKSIEFDLHTLINKAIALMTPRALERSVSLVADGIEQVPSRVIGDDGRLRQILLNLLGNALKFCDEQGVVILHAQVESDTAEGLMLKFAVSDTGIGIPEDKLLSIFEPFTQVDASSTRNFGGAGLGLSICRTLVNLMGGTISVKSTRGVGSRFEFTVRLEKANRPAQLPTHDSLDRPLAPLPHAPKSRHRVLLVEDNLVNQKLIKIMIERFGCDVAVANHGKEALDMIKSQNKSFHLVFMDCQMPEMDGFEATRQIRKLEESMKCHLPIVALTANVMVGDEQICLDAGMDGYLPKPIDRGELRKTLERFLVESIHQPR